jgi:hypothetical protein
MVNDGLNKSLPTLWLVLWKSKLNMNWIFIDRILIGLSLSDSRYGAFTKMKKT